MKAPIYEGRVASVELETSSITFQGLPNLLETALVSGDPHFAYVKSGSDEGMWLTISSYTENSVTVSLRAGDTLENLVVGEVVAIVPHWTPRILFGTEPTEGTYLFFYRNVGAGINHAASLVLVYTQGEWYNLSRFQPSSDIPLLPNEAMTIRNNDTTASFSLNVIGVVPMASQRTAIRTKAENTAEDQRFSFSSVVPQKIGEIGLPAKDGDYLFGYRNTTGINNATAYNFVYYDGTWRDLRNFNDVTDTFEMKPGFSYIYRKSATLEPEVLIWQHIPTYLGH